jgi:uncharacterized membrane protein
MLIKAKVALAVAIVLCTAATAGIAATKPHRAGAGPAYTAGSSETNQCLSTDNPCRPSCWPHCE